MNDKYAVKSEVLRLLKTGDCYEALKYAERFQPEGENLFIQVVKENAKELRGAGYFISCQSTGLLLNVVVNTVTDVKGRVWHLCSDDVWRHTQKNGKVVEKPYYYYVGSKRGVHKWSRWYPKTGRYFAPHPSESKGGILELVRTNEEKP